MAQPAHSDTIYLDGETLTPETLVALSSGKVKIDLTPEAWNQVQLSRNMIDEIAENDAPVYGINTNGMQQTFWTNSSIKLTDDDDEDGMHQFVEIPEK
ncbi:hypothetical protein BC830DRAFT_1165307 [Chytriomyces sp. MP71]|nr:hypothetical protein BC830DRAFT_1165307 [Chytriomyces sp. MP71]